MRKLLLFSCGFTGGCLLAVYWLPQRFRLIAAAAGLLLFGALLLFRALFACRARLIAAGLMFGLLWCWGYELLLLQPAWKQAGQNREISAQILDYPEQSNYGSCVKAAVFTGKDTYDTLLYYSDVPDELRPGDVISGVFTLRASSDGENEASGRYRLSEGLRLVGSGKIRTVHHPEHVSLRTIPLLTAHRLSSALHQAAPKDVSPFLRAILCGDRSELSSGTRHDLTTAGVSHIIAVSGMHVSLLMAALFLVLGRGGRKTGIIGIPILVFFAFLTGASPSVIRASVMLILMLLAPVFRRENDAPTNLGTAALIILLWNPWAVSSASFQLSFLAMAGLLLFTEPLYKHFKACRPWKLMLQWNPAKVGPIWLRNFVLRRWSKLVHGVLATLCATLAALSLTLPVSAVLYGSVSVYALLSNLLIVWAVCFCFVGAILTAIGSIIYLPLGQVFGWIIAWPVRYILWVSRLLARLPMASLPTSSVYTILFLVFTYLVLALTLILRKKYYGRMLFCIGGALVLAAVFTRLGTRVEHFSIAVLDVGQGQCVCLRTGEFAAVVDCGGSNPSKAGEAVSDYLNLAGVDSLDAVILSHYDLDHVGGVYELLDRVKVDRLYLPDVPFNPETRSAIEEAAAKEQIQIRYVTEDLRLPLADGAMTVFAPVSYESDNSASLAVLFTVGDYDLLITGDMDQYAEHKLLETHSLPDVEALVAGHHGSDSSTGSELLRAIRPETVIISVGKNNYGHPAASVLRRIEKIGAEVLTTEESGKIEIRR